MHSKKTKINADKLILPDAVPEHLFYIEIYQGEDRLISDYSKGELLISPIIGGFFDGAKLKGQVAGIGTGYTVATPPNKNTIEIKILLVTEDGASIVMMSNGILIIEPSQEAALIDEKTVNPADYYYRFHVTFETGSSKYDWLNTRCCIAVGGIKDWNTVCQEVYWLK